MTSFGARWVRTACIAAVLSAVSPTVLADVGHNHGAAIGEPAKASSATRMIEVTLGDMFFEPKTIHVKTGETIRFVLKNTGELLHEFNIGTASMHSAHQKEMMLMMEHGMLTPTGIDEEMMKMDHSKMGMAPMKHDDPNSVLVEPGKTKELVWRFTRAADLEFACNIPGHYDAGMVGNVEFSR